MAAFKQYEEIEAWRIGRKLVQDVYATTRVGEFSRDFGLRDQIQRAAVSDPLLSIVIANYNYGRFLEGAIQSVLSQIGEEKNQVRPGEVELIIIDGGSTDDSVDIIRKYAGGLPMGEMRPCLNQKGKVECEHIQELAEKNTETLTMDERREIVEGIEATRAIMIRQPDGEKLKRFVRGYWDGDAKVTKEIVEWGGCVIPGRDTNRYIGEIQTHKNSIRSILFHTRFRGPLKVLVLEHLGEMLENAVLYNKGRDGDEVFYNLAHRFVFEQCDGQPAKEFVARLIVKETADGNRTWTVEFSNKKELTGMPTTGEAATVEVTHLKSPSTHTILKIIYSVNGARLHQNLQPSTFNFQPLTYWVSEPDKGQSDAFNKGFAHARGRFLTWLNADDVLIAGALRRFLEAVRKNPEQQWFAGGSVHFGPDEKVILCTNTRRFSNYEAEHGQIVVYAPSSFFSRELFNKVGGFDESFRYSMDTHLWSLFFTQEQVRYTKLPGYMFGFRYHAGSKTTCVHFKAECTKSEEADRRDKDQGRVEHEKIQALFPPHKPMRNWMRLLRMDWCAKAKSIIDTWRYRGRSLVACGFIKER